ncbi:MAG: cytochrome C oxidase subunit IV family protein [Pseudolabrys sp.]|jgi:cytochrome c oxidase subunit 4
MKHWRPPRILLLSWGGLLALLTLTVFGAYQPLGAFNTGLALTIALCKALIVLAIFMELRERNALTIAFAGAGFFWLAIMLWLALSDFVTRPNFPPSPQTMRSLSMPSPARAGLDAESLAACQSPRVQRSCFV